MKRFDDASWLEEEQRLCTSARRGDDRAWRAIYETFADPLYGAVLLPRLKSRPHAEDALAETFRAAHSGLPSFQHPRTKSMWFWLHRIAVNKALDAVRSMKRNEAALRELPAESTEQADFETALDEPKRRAQVAAILLALPPRYRQAIELRFIEDRPREACAAAMNVSIGNFDVLLSRALKRAREIGER